MCSLTSRLSTVNSEDYKVWKSETLAKQSYQLEPAQTTGIWNQSMVECEVGEDLGPETQRSINIYLITD